MGVVAGAQSRTSAGLAGSLANLKKIGEVTGNYAADYEDQLWSFTWHPGYAPSEYDDLQNPADSVTAVAYQAVDIVRRLYRDDFPRFNNRFGSYWISTLVLADYLDESLPLEWVVSPGDKVRLEWQLDPDNPPDLNEQGGVGWSAMFAGFGSSYELMPAFFAPDERTDYQSTITQYKPSHNFTQVPPGLEFGGRRVSEVLFPSQKVHMAERASFFFGPTPTHYLHAEARVPVLMADGSVSPRTSADANVSFKPNNPDNPNSSLANYVPNLIYEPPTLSGGTKDFDIETHYKWTRRGLRGIDFNGQRAE
ncbi:hypothetical protein MNBD_PLANCTO03-1424 [hydrothermal vent metagenome]|uniref:Uncharacterized protein n=1 Tax=hydrothermal vent metagenome TaxID=652676 RepID=A0A3B1DQW7_9ZZZZ